MSDGVRIRRGKEVEIPEQFRVKGKPKQYKNSPPRKKRLPEVTRDRKMAHAPRIDEEWE